MTLINTKQDNLYIFNIKNAIFLFGLFSLCENRNGVKKRKQVKLVKNFYLKD